MSELKPPLAPPSSASAGTTQRTARPDHVPSRGRGHISARTIGALTPRVTKTAFQKFGFATAQLIADWQKIVGERLAATTAPDRIRWPRRAEYPEAGDSRDPGPRSGATLVIRVEPAVALDVQYKTALILDRINGYFGYRAVADIRLVQGQVAPAAPSRQTASQHRPQPARTPPISLAGIADEGLRAALERMQNGLRSRKG